MALYVTDTHPLLWYANRPAKLSKTAFRIFNRAVDGGDLIYVPAMVLIECGILQKIGRIRAKDSFDAWMNALLTQPGFELVQLEVDIIAQAIALQSINDPFDMSIVAAAKVKGIPLITADQAIIDSNLIDVAW